MMFRWFRRFRPFMMLGRFRRLMGMMMNRTGRKSHTYNGNTKKIQPLFHIQFISIKLDKKRLLRISTTFVELERFELSSKRGTNLLSTCLSSPSIVGNKQDRSHPLEPYPLKFRLPPKACVKLSPILLHHRIGTLRSNSIRVMSRPRNFCRD